MPTFSLPQRNPVKESGRSRLAAATHGAVPAVAEAERGDTRRMTRGVELATALAQQPTAAVPEAGGPGAMRTAADRFFSNAASAPHDLLQRHGAATYRRREQRPWGLAVHETPAVDWTAPRAATGVGPLGQTACPGLHVQSPLAVTPARGPLGLLAQPVWAREGTAVGQRARRQQRPMRPQERPTGLSSLDAVCRAPEEWPTTRVVSGGDREAEVADVWAAARPEGVERLRRAAWDRGGAPPERCVWATVAAQPGVEPLRLTGPRRGPTPGGPARLARRFGPLTRGPPRHRTRAGGPEVARWAVQVAEVAPPTAVEPIAWVLLTTGAVPTGADAIERVEWSACRWGLAVWQRRLNSGGRRAAGPWGTAERVPRRVPRQRSMAWRVVAATMLARALPELPCHVLVAIEAWHAWYCAIHHGPTPPEAPPTRDQAVRWIAPRGGVVGRRRADHPGSETLWRGVQHLSDRTRMYGMMRPVPPSIKTCVYLPAQRERGTLWLPLPTWEKDISSFPRSTGA